MTTRLAQRSWRNYGGPAAATAGATCQISCPRAINEAVRLAQVAAEWRQCPHWGQWKRARDEGIAGKARLRHRGLAREMQQQGDRSSPE